MSQIDPRIRALYYIWLDYEPSENGDPQAWDEMLNYARIFGLSEVTRKNISDELVKSLKERPPK